MEKKEKKKVDRGAIHRVNVTNIRCVVCMKKFGQRKVVKHQGRYYHQECLDDLRDKRHRNYKGRKQKDKKPPLRAV